MSYNKMMIALFLIFDAIYCQFINYFAEYLAASTYYFLIAEHHIRILLFGDAIDGK
ncbi:hypothetical protein DSUL_170037 [Desulfovibrionales bacterium]